MATTKTLSPWLVNTIMRLPPPTSTPPLPTDDVGTRPIIGQIAGRALASSISHASAGAHAHARVSVVDVYTADDDDDCAEEEFSETDDDNCPETVFDRPFEQTTDIETFVEQLTTQIPLCADALSLAMVYYDRIVSRGVLPVTTRNVHRIFATCFVLASKFAYDRVYSNKFYARISGMTITELNSLEIELMRVLGFRMAATDEEWSFYAAALASISAQLDIAEALQGTPAPMETRALPLELLAHS